MLEVAPAIAVQVDIPRPLHLSQLHDALGVGVPVYVAVAVNVLPPWLTPPMVGPATIVGASSAWAGGPPSSSSAAAIATAAPSATRMPRIGPP